MFPRLLKAALFSWAAVFLFWMLREVGGENLCRHLGMLKWKWPFLLIPYGLGTCLEAFSWRCLLVSPSPPPSLGLLFRLRLAGEALNTLTPTAGLGGEPFKASCLTAAGLPWEAATASVVIQKGITFLSLVLYILLGMTLTPFVLPLPPALGWFFSLAVLVLASLALLVVFLSAQGPCLKGLWWLERLHLCPAGLKEKAHDLARLDAHLARFYRRHPSRCLLSFALFFLAWLFHGVEVCLIFYLLGHPISWPLALCLDALAMLFTALGFFLPGALGIQDGGNILLALSFHLGAALGAAFGILRRLREAFWMGLGLFFALMATRGRGGRERF